MKTRAQVEPEYTYEVPDRYVRPYERDVRVDPEVVTVLLLSFAVAISVWCFSMWRLASKAGYRGGSRVLWFALLGFPLTTAWTLLVFVLLPWPVQRELKRKREEFSPSDISAMDRELDQLRRQLGQQ